MQRLQPCLWLVLAMSPPSSLRTASGGPQELLSDRGRVFLSEVIHELLDACHTVHQTTTVYHTQTNSLIERVNRALGDMLAMYISSDTSHWDQILPFVMCAYNTASQATTGFSLFFLFYGSEPSCLLDTALPYHVDSLKYSSISDIARHAKQCHQLAHSFTSDTQDLR